MIISSSQIVASLSKSAPPVLSRKRGYDQILVQKTGEVATQSLKRSPEKKCFVNPVAIAWKEVRIQIGHAGVNFELALFKFLDFIEARQKDMLLPTKALYELCKNISELGQANHLPQFIKMGRGRINWSDDFFKMVTETIEEILDILEEYPTPDHSAQISYSKLEENGISLDGLYHDILHQKKEQNYRSDEVESEEEFEAPLESLTILLTNPLGKSEVLASNSSKSL